MAEFNIALIPGDGIGPEIVSMAYRFRRKQLIFVKNQTVCF